MRRLLLGLGALLLISAPAVAGDRAVIDFIGYSEDGRYFAFEEFGIQDGSGFAYSSIYIVDLVEDAWVVGTPHREQADDEGVALPQLRAEVQLQAREDLAALDITVPVEVVALIGDGVPEDDGTSLRFGVPAYLPDAVQGDHRLSLSVFPATAVSPCHEWFSVAPQGYALSIDDGSGPRELHRDTTLPRSRGCPTTYRLYGVVMPFEGSIAEAVAIISVYPGGFEGPDRRFIAVPLGQ